MYKKLAALVLAFGLPGTAGAWEWGTLSAGTIDVYASPRISGSIDGDSATYHSDGVGVKGSFRVFEPFGFEFEFQNIDGVDVADGGTAVSLDGTSQIYRLGPALMARSGTGLFIDYIQSSSSSSTDDGYGVRGRLASQPVDDLHAFFQAGYSKIKGDDSDYSVLELSVGGTMAISKNWGLYTEYKRSMYKLESIDATGDEFRIGVRAGLDY